MTDVATKEIFSSFYKAWTEHNVELCRKLVCCPVCVSIASMDILVSVNTATFHRRQYTHLLILERHGARVHVLKSQANC